MRNERISLRVCVGEREHERGARASLASLRLTLFSGRAPVDARESPFYFFFQFNKGKQNESLGARKAWRDRRRRTIAWYPCVNNSLRLLITLPRGATVAPVNSVLGCARKVRERRRMGQHSHSEYPRDKRPIESDR